jgi:uncharacterized protein YjbI with pentapeptide repeats
VQGAPAIDGVSLGGRNLRFAILDESRLYRVDFSNADLRKASLLKVDLIDASLRWTKLQGAELEGAQMQRANLGFADMQGARLERARMQGVTAGSADMQGADLYRAQMGGADLRDANMQAADLVEASIQGANLFGAKLQCADLSHAVMQGADLEGVELQGADLTDVNMKAAKLDGAHLRRVKTSTKTILELADLRDADFHTQLTLAPETTSERQVLGEIPSGTWGHWHDERISRGEPREKAKERIERLCGAQEPSSELNFSAPSPDRPLLVSGRTDPALAKHPADWLVTEPSPSYDKAFVESIVGEVAPVDPFIAESLVQRTLNFSRPSGAPPFGQPERCLESRDVLITCLLLDSSATRTPQSRQVSKDRLSAAFRKWACPSSSTADVLTCLTPHR